VPKAATAANERVRGSAATALRLAPNSLQGRAPGEASSYQSCVMRSRKAGTHAPATVMQCVRGLVGQDAEDALRRVQCSSSI